MAIYVLDTSAVLAFLKNEPGEERVNELLEAARGDSETRILLPFMTLMEVEYQGMRSTERERADYWVDVVLGWPVELVESSPRWRLVASRVKSQGGLSLGDSWVASLALMNEAELIHKDPEFDQVDGLQAIRLPYDRDTRRGNRG